MKQVIKISGYMHKVTEKLSKKEWGEWLHLPIGIKVIKIMPSFKFDLIKLTLEGELLPSRNQLESL